MRKISSSQLHSAIHTVHGCFYPLFSVLVHCILFIYPFIAFVNRLSSIMTFIIFDKLVITFYWMFFFFIENKSWNGDDVKKCNQICNVSKLPIYDCMDVIKSFSIHPHWQAKEKNNNNVDIHLRQITMLIIIIWIEQLLFGQQTECHFLFPLFSSLFHALHCLHSIWRNCGKIERKKIKKPTPRKCISPCCSASNNYYANDCKCWLLACCADF